MNKILRLSDAMATKKINHVRINDERENQMGQILNTSPPSVSKRPVGLAEAVQIFEHKLASCEESFYEFTRSTID